MRIKNTGEFKKKKLSAQGRLVMLSIILYKFCQYEVIFDDLYTRLLYIKSVL